MKKWTSIVLAVILLAIGLAVPAGACIAPLPMPQGPFFSYSRLNVDDNIVVIIDRQEFYAYNNGALRQLEPTQDSLISDLIQLTGHRHVHTDELRWLSFVSSNPLVVHEVAFDFEDFSYIVTELAPQTWLEDPAFQEKFEARNGSETLAWLDVWVQESRVSRLAAGYADDEVMLRLLTDPDFAPEPPRFVSSFGYLDEIPSNSLEAPRNLWPFAVGSGGVVLLAAAVAVPLIIRRRRKRDAPES